MRRVEVTYVDIPDFGGILIPKENTILAENYLSNMVDKIGVFKIDEPYECNTINGEEITTQDAFVSIGTTSDYDCYTEADIINQEPDVIAPFVDDIIKFANYYEYDMDSELLQFLSYVEKEYDYDQAMKNLLYELYPDRLRKIDDLIDSISKNVNSIVSGSIARGRTSLPQREITRIKSAISRDMRSLQRIIPDLIAPRFSSSGLPIVSKDNTIYDYIEAASKGEITMEDLLMSLEVIGEYVQRALSHRRKF